MIFLICCKKTIGGCLKFGEGGWLHHFFIKASFIVDTYGWYCHERQKFFFFLVVLFQERVLPLSLFLTAAFLSNCVGSLCLSSVFEIERRL